jgi:transcriptional regulator with XRE-family HTH domain
MLMRIFNSVDDFAGLRLKAWRVEHGLSQEELAQRAREAGFEDVGQPYISLLENGEIEPSARRAAFFEEITKRSVRAGDEWLNAERRLALAEQRRKRTARAVGE